MRGDNQLCLEVIYSPDDLLFLFDKNFKEMISSPDKYSKQDFILACRNYRDYLERAS